LRNNAYGFVFAVVGPGRLSVPSPEINALLAKVPGA
jgi:hypothetical protein